jgi:hypothetical protein
MRKSLISAATLALFGAVMAGPASAIECEGNYQIQRNGNRIATPYCQDGYLAIVAREYGMRVSAQAIRYNPSVKREACRLAGHDNRVRSTCTGYLPEDDSGDRFIFR